MTFDDLEPHQQRVVLEMRDLNDRLMKLIAFTETPRFLALDEGERGRLTAQKIFMAGYAEILRQRVSVFTGGVL